MPIFTASRVSSDSNVLYPDVVAIDRNNVTYYKGHPFGYETIIIPRHTICSVYLRSSLFFADIIITSSGGTAIVARGYKKSVAKQIVNILT